MSYIQQEKDRDLLLRTSDSEKNGENLLVLSVWKILCFESEFGHFSSKIRSRKYFVSRNNVSLKRKKSRFILGEHLCNGKPTLTVIVQVKDFLFV